MINEIKDTMNLLLKSLPSLRERISAPKTYKVLLTESQLVYHGDNRYPECIIKEEGINSWGLALPEPPKVGQLISTEDCEVFRVMEVIIHSQELSRYSFDPNTIHYLVLVERTDIIVG